jgi:hypothetical protein
VARPLPPFCRPSDPAMCEIWLTLAAVTPGLAFRGRRALRRYPFGFFGCFFLGGRFGVLSTIWCLLWWELECLGLDLECGPLRIGRFPRRGLPSPELRKQTIASPLGRFSRLELVTLTDSPAFHDVECTREAGCSGPAVDSHHSTDGFSPACSWRIARSRATSIRITTASTSRNTIPKTASMRSTGSMRRSLAANRRS